MFGTGGTGGFALEYLTRLYAESSQRVTIELYDGDDVEAKNLKRQNFTVNDLDMNKAEALVKRLSQYILNPPTFITHNEYVTDADELEDRADRVDTHVPAQRRGENADDERGFETLAQPDEEGAEHGYPLSWTDGRAWRSGKAYLTQGPMVAASRADD